MSALEASIAALRSEGAWRLDPVRFHYLEALARRLPGQPEPVRRLLQARLQAALADYAGRLAQAQPAAPPAAAPAACAPLAQLNQSIRAARGAGREDELASVRRFRRAWSRSRSLDQVEQAAARKPANAGPLNSHVLVLQSLALMGELSPDYLRRFLVQVESLQWLERARAKYPRQAAGAAQAAKPARRGRQKK